MAVWVATSLGKSEQLEVFLRLLHTAITLSLVKSEQLKVFLAVA
jgi:hypothetical protein